MNEDVTKYIRKNDQKWQVEICNAIREIIHTSLADVEERIQYGKPHFLKNAKYLCVLGVAKGWVSLTIFNARQLKAPEGFFESGGNPERKTIKILDGQDFDYELLARLLQQAANS